MILPSIKRVVSSFILTGGTSRDDLQIAVFHRVITMPTFPDHWAACSGSIEREDEAPWDAARRELLEETNLPQDTPPDQPGGLFVDVPFSKPNSENKRIIRVYPFTVRLPLGHTLELKGTEHDTFQFVSVAELEETLHPVVPGLARAFHHATYGAYKKDVTPEMRQWANDRTSGAATMAQNAVQLIEKQPQQVNPETLRLLRPSMVVITNALNQLILTTTGQNNDSCMSPSQVMEWLQKVSQQTVEVAVGTIEPLVQEHLGKNTGRPFCIATHSRSSTVLAVLQRLLKTINKNDKVGIAPIRVLCGQSTPGDEGKIMAKDLGMAVAECVPDRVLLRERVSEVDLLLVGCDCLTEQHMVNKVGTRDLIRQLRTQSPRAKVYCCVDRGKLWEDVFPPPLEPIFECVPRQELDEILCPPDPSNVDELSSAL